MKFTKMQAYGNDYIYINVIDKQIDDINKIAKILANRHYGIGSDGLVLIDKSKIADFKMRIFNPDGTEAEMCGNALRSVGKYVYEYNLTKKIELTIETIGGIKTLYLDILNDKVINIKANIGKPIFESTLIPVNTKKDKFIEEEVEILGKKFLLSTISLGNPHTVVFIYDIDNFDVAKYGRAIENYQELFPKKTNVTFAQIENRNLIKIREWERGTGETIGCGTGCCSAVVIAYTLGLVNDKCLVKQIGGYLEVEYKDNKELFMKGPSNIVFEGNIDLTKIGGYYDEIK